MTLRPPRVWIVVKTITGSYIYIYYVYIYTVEWDWELMFVCSSWKSHHSAFFLWAFKQATNLRYIHVCTYMHWHTYTHSTSTHLPRCAFVLPYFVKPVTRIKNTRLLMRKYWWESFVCANYAANSNSLTQTPEPNPNSNKLKRMWWLNTSIYWAATICNKIAWVAPVLLLLAIVHVFLTDEWCNRSLLT